MASTMPDCVPVLSTLSLALPKWSWTSGLGAEERWRRTAVLDLIALHFWVVDQPTRNDRPILGDYVRIDMGEIAGLKLAPTVSLQWCR